MKARSLMFLATILSMWFCTYTANSARCYGEEDECQQRSLGTPKSYNLYCMNGDDDNNAWEQCIAENADPTYLKFVETSEKGPCPQCLARRLLPSPNGGILISTTTKPPCTTSSELWETSSLPETTEEAIES